MNTPKVIVWFLDARKEDVSLVGGKGANLGEIVKQGFSVPNGFIVTSRAYDLFLKENNLRVKINHLLETANFDKIESLEKVSKLIKKEIASSPLSNQLVREIFASYRKLGGTLKDALVAVRSSGTHEDQGISSFAGLEDSFLNIKGEANLILKIKEVWALLFNPRLIFYRYEFKLDHFRLGIAVLVQKMVESEKAGVMFTIDPLTTDKTKIIIEAIYGLGELVAWGEITPDHYEVIKNDLSISVKSVNPQSFFLKRVASQNKKIKISKAKGEKQKISDEQVIALAKIGKKLEKHYYFPQDIEWAIEKNKIYILQTKPVTTIIQNSIRQLTDKIKDETNIAQPIQYTVLLRGDPASPGIASGPVRIINSAKQIDKVLRGEILVIPQINPDFVQAMKKAAGIITDKEGKTFHAAVILKQLGIPAIVGTNNATNILKTGDVITVNAIKGEVYKGGYISSSRYSTSIEPSTKTKTKVYVNLSQEKLVQKISAQDFDGIGLLRAEFMMAQIGIHPKKLIRDGQKQVFVDKLSESLEKFCEAFGSRPVVYRTSNLKTNEYRNLIGGRDFEPEESNPMLGLRGAFRYINDPEVFNLELEAIKRVRNTKDYKNLWIMIPFVRTVKELIEVKKLISGIGLYRSSNFKIWMMVEIPSNVILLEKFIHAGIDGVSIATNNLAMLLLGIDKDNSEVAREFDEQNESVLWALEHVIKTCRKYKITSSICGQEPTIYPTLLEKLVEWGIDSVSISPDALDSTRKLILSYEKKQGL